MKNVLSDKEILILSLRVSDSTVLFCTCNLDLCYVYKKEYTSPAPTYNLMVFVVKQMTHAGF